MSVGFMARKEFTLPVSGAMRFTFSNASAPWASFQIYRQFGSQDMSFRLWSSNFSAKDVPGDGNFGTENSLSTGSSYTTGYNYWFLEPGISGSLTGSATDAPSPFAFHLVDVSTKHIMIEVSSSSGGKFILYPHIKGT